MACNAFSMTATAKSMVTHSVREVVAGWASGLGAIYGATKTVLHGHCELLGAKTEAKGRRGHHRKPVTGVLVAQTAESCNLALVSLLREFISEEVWLN